MSTDSKIPNEDELWDVLNTPTEAPEKKAAPKAAPREKAQKSGRKIDGFYLGSMAGVAAVSVAVTLFVSSMAGGSASVPGSAGGSGDLEALRKENAQLKSQVEMQQQTILDLQNNLMDFMGTEEFLEIAATAPSGENDVLEKQTEAYEILTQIQNAYTVFDREKLEELIPEMDKRLEYLNEDALNSYYVILEYMEQPSNG